MQCRAIKKKHNGNALQSARKRRFTFALNYNDGIAMIAGVFTTNG